MARISSVIGTTAGLVGLGLGVGVGWFVWSGPPKVVTQTRATVRYEAVAVGSPLLTTAAQRATAGVPHVDYLDASRTSFPASGGTVTFTAGLHIPDARTCTFYSATFGYHRFACAGAQVVQWTETVPSNSRPITRHWLWHVEAHNAKGWSDVESVTIDQAPTPAVTVGGA